MNDNWFEIIVYVLKNLINFNLFFFPAFIYLPLQNAVYFLIIGELTNILLFLVCYILLRKLVCLLHDLTYLWWDFAFEWRTLLLKNRANIFCFAYINFNDFCFFFLFIYHFFLKCLHLHFNLIMNFITDFINSNLNFLFCFL